jgi:hypothetical protein
MALKMLNKITYNIQTSKSLGWQPDWFGASKFDGELIRAITQWQKENKLKADGMVGPVTFRRIYAQRKANEAAVQTPPILTGQKHIIHNNKKFKIDWDKVILWTDKEGMSVNSFNTVSADKERKPFMFVNHWDACLSSKDCVTVLNRRKLSVHFCIDNDGTIYQLMDTQHIAWHAGGRNWNANSVGVEIANAYYLKYQNWYVRNGFGERPIVNDAICHNVKMPKFLGFYPVQLEALKALWKACNEALDIPLDWPKDANGKLVTGVDKNCESSNFKGIINHYNLTRNKIDCAGLNIDELIKSLK